MLTAPYGFNVALRVLVAVEIAVTDARPLDTVSSRSTYFVGTPFLDTSLVLKLKQVVELLFLENNIRRYLSCRSSGLF
jgi:hypothetical protein